MILVDLFIDARYVNSLIHQQQHSTGTFTSFYSPTCITISSHTALPEISSDQKNCIESLYEGVVRSLNNPDSNPSTSLCKHLQMRRPPRRLRVALNNYIQGSLQRSKVWRFSYL